MLKTTLCVSLALVAFACKDKDKDKEGAAASGGGGGGPLKTTPKDLFADFSPNSSIKGMDLLDKYREGVTFTGTVTQVVGNPDGAPVIWLDVDGKNRIDVKFKDDAKGKSVKKGDSLTITCKVGGESGTTLYVIDCV